MNENSEDAEAEFLDEFHLKCNISVKMLQMLEMLQLLQMLQTLN
jgi:hypothetical protein